MSALTYKYKRLGDVARGARQARRAAERERWLPEQIEHWRTERLRELVAHAIARSPFWREQLGGLREPFGVQDLPVLDKTTMMDRFDELVTDQRLRRDDLLEHLDSVSHDALYLGSYRAMTTSGSSGSKGLFVYDRFGWTALVAQYFRYSAWAGVAPRIPRLRIASVGGASPTHMTARLGSTLSLGIHRVLALPATLPVAELVRQLNDFQPQWINIYPSVAALLVGEQQAGRLRLKLEGMSTSSELQTPELAARLESAFGVKPMNFYATTEGLWGCECEERAGVHLFEDMTIVENVDADGRPVPDGEPGTALRVTNLFNRVQPLIRLEVSDVVVIDPAPCPCGRTLRRLRAIEGRLDDVLELAGVSIVPLQFGVVAADPGVRQFQVVQQGERLRVRVVPSDTADVAALCERVATRVRERLGDAGVPDPQVDVELCSELERRGGKVKLIVADAARRAMAKASTGSGGATAVPDFGHGRDRVP